ncbi:MAG: ABC transporter ATP-binding protein [Promethearchaeota archaeon]
MLAKSAKSAKSGLTWVGKYFLKYPIKSFYVFFFAICEVLIFSFPIQITANIIDIVIEGGGLSEAKGQILFLLGLAIFQALLFFSISFLNEVLAHRMTTDMTQDLFESLQFRSLTYHDSQDVGDIMARATGDTRIINIAISPAVRLLFATFAIWIVNIVFAWKVNWRLGVIAIVICILFVLTSLIYAKKLIPFSKRSRESFSEVSQIASNCITGIQEIKGFKSEIWANREFTKKARKLQKREIREGMRGAWFYPMLAVTLFSSTMIALSLYFGFTNQYGVDIHDIIVIAGYITLMAGVSEELEWSMAFLVRAKAGADRIYKVINDNDIGEYINGKEDFDNKPSSIEFKDVSFRYKESLPYCLKNISFKIEENQTIAIVGGPGSGKSTLTKLVQRLYMPTSGKILLGGHPIQNFDNEILRKIISTVEQDIFLFNETIFENIRFGKPEASKDEVIEIAKLAQAHDFIMEMPNQYENLIGEGGVRLSGGQAQRLSIARALLVNPSILIMDDGASALDARTEIKIQEAISNILETHTTLITTHRLAIIAKADAIIILDKGEMVGLGTHETLIRKNIYYRRLFERHYDLPPFEGDINIHQDSEQTFKEDIENPEIEEILKIRRGNLNAK